MNTPNPTDCTSLDKGDIRFYDNYVPALGVGDYTITIGQVVNPPGIDDSYNASQQFSVSGPRYSLPAEDIHSSFPADNAIGIFDQLLPNIVLTKPELPWEKNVFADAARTTQTPWLALLSFVEGDSDLLAPNLTGWVPNRTMIANLTAADFYDWSSGSPASRTQPDANGVLWPALTPEWYEEPDFLHTTPTSFIDIAPAAFVKLLPCKADLRYLAHARQVDMTAKDESVLGISGDGWYSVLVGNRLGDAPPAGSALPGKRNIVHLVSLEGFTSYIGQTSVTTPPGSRVRMISLQSWTYTCLPEGGESFSELMTGLLLDTQGNDKSTSFTLALPDAYADDSVTTHAAQAMQSGYVPMRYQTRLGEETFGWYRGPFSPVPTTNFISKAGTTPFSSASSAMIYDTTYGVFNLSYGIAFETGRLLALSNGVFGPELCEWQRSGQQTIDLIMERKQQLPVATLKQQLQPFAVTDDFVIALARDYKKDLSLPLPQVDQCANSMKQRAFADRNRALFKTQSLTGFLQQPDVLQAVQDAGSDQLQDVCNILANWYLLSGVPFENLVPNESLLPNESIKFFYLDSNWLDAMVEGALSIGIESSLDKTYQDLMKDQIWTTTHQIVQTLRDQALGSFASNTPSGSTIPFDQESMTGMLLRSAAVSALPGLEINGYLGYTVDTDDGSARPDYSKLIKPLRVARLSGDVMLILWPTVPACVSIDEPREGIAFGFEDPPGHTPGPGCYLYLRALTGTNYGMPMCSDAAIDAGTCTYQIDAIAGGFIDANRLVDVSGLRAAMQNALQGATINVRDFAVEMIRVPEQAVFATPAATS